VNFLQTIECLDCQAALDLLRLIGFYLEQHSTSKDQPTQVSDHKKRCLSIFFMGLSDGGRFISLLLKCDYPETRKTERLFS
jgi:hypothetical protein